MVFELRARNPILLFYFSEHSLLCDAFADRYSFCVDVIFDSFNLASRDEDGVLDQIYEFLGLIY